MPLGTGFKLSVLIALVATVGTLPLRATASPVKQRAKGTLSDEAAIRKMYARLQTLRIKDQRAALVKAIREMTTEGFVMIEGNKRISREAYLKELGTESPFFRPSFLKLVTVGAPKTKGNDLVFPVSYRLTMPAAAQGAPAPVTTLSYEERWTKTPKGYRLAEAKLLQAKG